MTVDATPSAEQVEQITQAVIQKATRILALSHSPLGLWGGDVDFGPVPVRSDYEIAELLYGLRLVNWDIDLTSLVTTEDVIRVGLQAANPATYPVDQLPDVQRAIDAAVAWVAVALLYGFGVA